MEGNLRSKNGDRIFIDIIQTPVAAAETDGGGVREGEREGAAEVRTERVRAASDRARTCWNRTAPDRRNEYPY